MYPIILSQGKFTHKDHLTYPFEERGLQFGDGVYEVIRIYQGELYLLEEHTARLFRSLKAVRIQIEQTHEQMKSTLQELVKRNQVDQDGFIYLQITRGSAARVHVFPEDTTPNMYAYVVQQPRHVDKIEQGVHAITLPDERWENCYIKSLNLLPNVLAKQTAMEHDCYEAILHRGEIVTECGSSNIFLVKDGKIYTHPTTNQILGGCVRIAVKRFASSLQIPFIEEAFTVEDIFKSDEMFLTSSISEVLPVVQVDNIVIADGKPGKVSKALQKVYEEDANITRIHSS